MGHQVMMAVAVVAAREAGEALPAAIAPAIQEVLAVMVRQKLAAVHLEAASAVMAVVAVVALMVMAIMAALAALALNGRLMAREAALVVAQI